MHKHQGAECSTKENEPSPDTPCYRDGIYQDLGLFLSFNEMVILLSLPIMIEQDPQNLSL